jgi:hypothetical protein
LGIDINDRSGVAYCVFQDREFKVCIVAAVAIALDFWDLEGYGRAAWDRSHTVESYVVVACAQLGGFVGSGLPGHVVALDVRNGCDVGAVHEARIVRRDDVAGSHPPNIPAVTATRPELHPEEVNMPAVVEHLVGSHERTSNMIVLVHVSVHALAAK